MNGSLWTLAPEFVCYVALAVMPRRWPIAEPDHREQVLSPVPRMAVVTSRD